jgi:predicted  nucleic acid-binding Zn-ribbon protein
MTEMSIKGFVKHVQKELAKLVGRIALLEETVDGDGADVLALEAEVENLNDRIEVLESALASMQRRSMS